MKLNQKVSLASTLPVLAALLTLTLSGFATRSAQASGPTAEDTYRNLGNELNAQFRTEDGPLLGVSTQQKNNPAGHPSFCRRTHPIVPHATYSYACYNPTLTGADAEAMYSGSNERELGVVFSSAESGDVIVGRGWKEKYIGSAEAAICVKTEAIVPHAVPTYTCYSNLGNAGGAVSGGN